MKRYVLPTFRALIAVVIAAALVKIAFFPAHQQGGGAQPEAGFAASTQTVAVEVGDVSNTIDVTGQIVEDAAVPAKATLAGTVASLAVAEGTAVNAGDALLTIKGSEPVPDKKECVATEDGGQECQMVPQPPRTVTATVTAPATGTVSYAVIKDQETTVGTVVASVRPGTYSAVGTIAPAQQYQLTTAPTTATLTIEGGPAPFECTGLTIGSSTQAPAATTDADATSTTPGDTTSVQVRCPVPGDQTVFPGLSVTISIDAGSAAGVLTVPVTAVEGSSTTGNVWVVSDPDHPDKATKQDVTLGISDGSVIEVTGGLEEGQEILMFVPGKVTLRTGEPNTCDQFACYDENGQEQL